MMIEVQELSVLCGGSFWKAIMFFGRSCVSDTRAIKLYQLSMKVNTLANNMHIHNMCRVSDSVLQRQVLLVKDLLRTIIIFSVHLCTKQIRSLLILKSGSLAIRGPCQSPVQTVHKDWAGLALTREEVHRAEYGCRSLNMCSLYKILSSQ